MRVAEVDVTPGCLVFVHSGPERKNSLSEHDVASQTTGLWTQTPNNLSHTAKKQEEEIGVEHRAGLTYYYHLRRFQNQTVVSSPSIQGVRLPKTINKTSKPSVY